MPRNRRSVEPEVNCRDERNFKTFHFNPFDPETEEWTCYKQRFTIELKVMRIEDEDDKRDLFLSKIGPKTFKVLVDHYYPQLIGKNLWRFQSDD